MHHINISVEEFTTPSPVTATEDQSLEEIAVLMRDFGIGHIPIVRNDRVIGIISDRDLRFAAGLGVREEIFMQASDVMVANPVTVSAGAYLDDVVFEMSQNKIGCVIVNDENDALYGVFTVTDALNALIEISRNSKVNEIAF